MNYPYHCPECNYHFEVLKSVAEIDNSESCPKCLVTSNRTIAVPNLMAVNDWTESFNYGLGCVVKNKAHQREILRKYADQGRELIEIGTEPVENLHKKYDRQREDKRKERWNEPVDKVLKEGLA